jgi:hypothetical protein
MVLDMDSTEIPVYGQQEQSAYNGHFGLASPTDEEFFMLPSWTNHVT